MASDDQGLDNEFHAMRAVYDSLSPLDDQARRRVIEYIMARFDMGGATVPTKAALLKPAIDPANEEGAHDTATPRFDTFAELHDAAQPKSMPEKALVAGYWLQCCEAADSFDGFSANKELKNLGHGIPNITNAIEGLKSQKPALALQLKKSGKSQQARKTYKITHAGIKAVEAMIRG